MNNIAFTMSNVSQVAVSPINADGTVAQGSSDNTLVFAGVVVSQKGQPNELLAVNARNWRSVLGKPYHSSHGVNADPMRSLGEALEGGNGYVVRVVPSTATFPALKFTKPDADVVIANEAITYGSDLSLAAGEFFAIAIKDGAESDNRKISMVKADEAVYGAGMFVLTLVETDDSGSDTTLEEWIVSLDSQATDDMGTPVFIETVLDSRSSLLTCVIDEQVAKAELVAIPETAFTGASNGSIADITADDYQKAIEVLANTVIPFTYVCGLSCYEPAVIKDLIALMNARRISGAFDINPRLTHAEGLAAKQDLALNEPRAAFVHIPYTSTCPYYQNRTLWGASGVVFRAKARGVARTSPTGGWHFTPAGVDRATISRTAMRPIKGVGTADHEAMYKARLNKLAINENGALFIDDSLTSCAKENYLRFEQVVSTTDAISRAFYALANRLKHQPDGITLDGLTDGMTEILEGFESVGALVPPRNPEQDGTAAWVFEVQQVEIDYWKVTWSICVTGSGRRFLGEPILIR